MVEGRLLRASGIVKRFGNMTALNGVSLSVSEGEVHALVGENGAGKSTLMNIINGALQSDEGTVEIDGVPVSFSGPSDAIEHGVAMVHQEPKLAAPLTVAENIYMGRLPRKRWGAVDRAELHARVGAVLESIGVPLAPDAAVSGLTIASRQFVQVAKAVSLDARLIILDEPTASLTPVEVTQLFELVQRLKANGVAFIYISHHLDEIFRIAERVSVLKDGEMVSSGAVGETTKAELIRAMVGRELGSHFPDHVERVSGDVVLQAEGISGPGFADVDLRFRRGEIVGLAGLIGSGRTELARALCGAAPILAGRLKRGDRAIRLRSAADGAKEGIAYLAEDRRDSVVRPLSVMQNITLAARTDFARRGVINHARERAVARDYVERLRIRTTGIDQPAGELSGGNQQKCVIARWLMRNSELVIFDEPTRGIDVGAKREIYGLIQQLAADGRAVLMISSELPEILGMCDRVLVMQSGRLNGELARSEATERSILELAVPHTKEDAAHA